MISNESIDKRTTDKWMYDRQKDHTDDLCETIIPHHYHVGGIKIQNKNG